MKIYKYNEMITDNVYYEGDINIHFKVPYKEIESYGSIFSYNWHNLYGKNGLIEHFVLNHINAQQLIVEDYPNIKKIITYKLYVDGNEIDEQLFNKSNKYNLI